MAKKLKGTFKRFTHWLTGSNDDFNTLGVSQSQRRRGEGVSSYQHVASDEDVLLKHKKSIDFSLPRLTKEEYKFFKLVESGNVQRVSDFLLCTPNFNINCKNYQSLSALDIAVKNDDKEMVKALLQWENLLIGDAFLHAIDIGSLSLMETIIQGCYGVKSRENVEKEPSRKNCVSFPPNTTPLMLAAHKGNYEIIRFLIQRQHTIEPPHSPTCCCGICTDFMKREDLVDAMVRLNVYKAIANPVFICQSSDDPILTAFELCTELKQVAKIEGEYSDHFIALANKCSKFAVDLLDKCRTTHEVETLLHRKEGMDMSNKRAGWRFTRIGLALQHDQKAFVAHSSCQQALRSAWLDGFPNWKRSSRMEQLWKLLPRVAIVPLIVVLHILAPTFSKAAGLSKPLQKYISHATTYYIFLAVIIAQTALDAHKDEKGPPDTGLEMYIIIYIIALLYKNLKVIWTSGITSYMSHKWHVYDLCMIVMFIAAFLCWAWCAADISDKEHISFTQRRYWGPYEPTLIAESVYSIAVVMAFARIMFFFQIFTGIGPLQLSFSRMFKDILNFFFIFLAVMIAFAIGLYKLYHNYAGMVKSQGGEIVRQDDAFVTMENTMATLYWALYGYGGPEFADLVVSEYMERSGNETVIVYNHHRLTEMVGRTIFAVYHIAGFIILFNMLIAMMTQSLEKINENADIEWKFNRTKVWMTFVQQGDTLPPPFNLIPRPYRIILLIKWFYKKLTGSPDARWNPHLCCYIEDEESAEQKAQYDKAYTETMAYLVQRYLTDKNNLKEESAATKEDIENVRYHIRDLKDLLNSLCVIDDDDEAGKSKESLIEEQESEDSVFLKKQPSK